MMKISKTLSIPESEVRFTFSRSGGPGGQNVNKVETRATLWFDVSGSPSLTEGQKVRIAERLAGRITREGVLRVVSQRHRTQPANQAAARERFIELVRGALEKREPRLKTKVPAGARRRRREEKRRRSQKKQTRSSPPSWDD